MKKLLLFPIFAFYLSCQQKNMQNIEKSIFGTLPDGQTAHLYTLTNKNGLVMKVSNYGCIITHLFTPDKNGKMEDVVLGYDSLAGYLKDSPYFGSVIGRYGNRIANGEFSIDNTTYKLAVNNGKNHLHGGLQGFDKVLWKVTESLNIEDGVGIEFSYLSKDMEEGYPGNLEIRVRYVLDNDNQLKIDYWATTDKKTVVNLTQHTYFNLSACKDSVLNHELKIAASHYLPVDNTLIPTGEVKSVLDSPFDFQEKHSIGERINIANEQIQFGGGYDHCLVFNPKQESNINTAIAWVHEPKSGRVLEVFTTEPAVQLYTGNFLNGGIQGKNDVQYKKRMAFCLETQHYPDSPNRPEFPSTLLEPNQTYRSTTIYKFSNLSTF